MWHLLSKLFGSSGRAERQHTLAELDPRDIRFSLPTVAADDLQFVAPTADSFDGAPQFHEDEWSQIEFFPTERRVEIQQSLSRYKVFESAHRTPHGWTDIFARSVKRDTVVRGGSAVEELADLLQANKCPSPILFTASAPLGQVENGFTLHLQGGLLLYGILSSEGITTLGARVETDSAHLLLTKAFTALFNTYQLFLVDWQAQQSLISVAQNGEINVWNP